jgi:DNA-binding transcriptional LysR family regulator
MDPALVPALYDALIVARLGSVGAAARHLKKTPSAVSQQIRRLTEAFGVALFERRGRGLVLTPAAEQVLPLATRLFDEAEAVFREFGTLQGTASATLRVAASDYLGKSLLVPVLRGLAEEGAPLHFEITTAHSKEALARLEQGDVEMAIASFTGKRPGLEARTLFEQPFYWVGPLVRADRRPLFERIAAGEPALRLAPGSGGRQLFDRLLEEHGIRPKSTIDVPSVSLVLAYATGGVGIGLVPALALADQPLNDVAVARAGGSPLTVRLARRAQRRTAPVVERVIDRLEREAARLRPKLAKLGSAVAKTNRARGKDANGR